MKTLRKILSLVLAVAMLMSVAVVAFATSEDDAVDNFADYKDADAAKASDYAEAIDLVIGLGIIKGMSATEIGIDGKLTRAQAAKITAYVALGEKIADALAASETGFKDVPASQWASKYIAYCVSEGWIAGYGDGNFGPDDDLTGMAFAKMLLNAMGRGFIAYVDPQTGLPKTANDYVGTYWQTKVSKDANTIGLFDDVNNDDLSKAITRAEAMQMVYNAMLFDGGVNYAYAPVAVVSAGAGDSYGRSGYYWDDGTGEAVSGAYVRTGAWTYKVTNAAAGTVANILKAYQKEVGDNDYAWAAGGAPAGALPTGTVAEFTVNKAAKTISYYVSYGYEIDEVTAIAAKAEANAPHKGAYKVTLKSGATPYTDDFGGSVKKGDILAIPYSYENAARVYADTVTMDATTAKATAYNANAGDPYVTVNGTKTYADANFTATDINTAVAAGTVFAADFNTAYDYYLNPEVGSLLAAKVNTGETTVAYTLEYGYIIDMESRAYGAAAPGSMLGAGATAEVSAAAVIKMETSKGEAKVLNLAIAKKGTAGTAADWQFTGKDSINPFANATPALGKQVETIAVTTDTNIGKIASYYTNDDGTIVVTAITAPATFTTAKGSATITTPAGKFGTSDTVIHVVTVTAGPKYAASTITGYKNFTNTTYNTAIIILDTNDAAKVVEVYAFEQPAAAPAPTKNVANAAYFLGTGDTTADGTEYKFLVKGEPKSYFVDGDTTGPIPGALGDIVIITEKDGIVTKFAAPLTDADVTGTVDRVDAGYVVIGGTMVDFGKLTANVYDTTGNGLTLDKATTARVLKGTDCVVIFILS